MESYIDVGMQTSSMFSPDSIGPKWLDGRKRLKSQSYFQNPGITELIFEAVLTPRKQISSKMAPTRATWAMWGNVVNVNEIEKRK